MKKRLLRGVKIVLYLLLALAIAVIVKESWEHFHGPLHDKWPWWPDWSSADVLAVIAIAFALVQFLDARQGERTMNTIALSMSTRFAGPFPENLKEIVDLISKAERHLKVIVDFPCYGQYSAPEEHLQYIQTVERGRVREVQIQIICYNRALADGEAKEQFPDDQSEFNSRDKKRFNHFFHLKNETPCTDFACLRTLLRNCDEQMIQQLKSKGVSWKFHEKPAAFFLWLRDDTEAVFTFKNVGRKDVGLSFRTQDANLIRQFIDIFDRRWQNASDEYQ